MEFVARGETLEYHQTPNQLVRVVLDHVEKNVLVFWSHNGKMNLRIERARLCTGLVSGLTRTVCLSSLSFIKRSLRMKSQFIHMICLLILHQVSLPRLFWSEKNAQ